MMRNQTKRFEIWFSVRLEEIHETTQNFEWRYCSTGQIPADHLSRGVTPGDCKRSESFYGGADFLKLPEEEWPQNLEEKEEQVSCVSHLYVVKEEPEKEEVLGIQKMIDFYSSEFMLKRAVCFLIRVVKKILYPTGVSMRTLLAQPALWSPRLTKI